MPTKKRSHHGRGKQGPDGLSDRERAFAHERRKDPTSAGWIIAERAGFLGGKKGCSDRACELMKKPAVLAIIHKPDRAEPINEDLLKTELQQFFRDVVRGNASPADKIRAADKLGATLQGFYVPVQVDMRAKLTMESIVREMGGAPEESVRGMLPGRDDPDKEIQ